MLVGHEAAYHSDRPRIQPLICELPNYPATVLRATHTPARLRLNQQHMPAPMPQTAPHLMQPDMPRGKGLRSLQRSTMRVAYMMGLNWGRGRRSICPNSTSASSGSNS